MCKRQKTERQGQVGSNFPKYELNIGGQMQYHSLHEAARYLDNGNITVEVGEHVMTRAGTFRPLNDEDKDKISQATKNYSNGK